MTDFKQANKEMTFSNIFMGDLYEKRGRLLIELKSAMSKALANDPHVRLSIENIDFMNLAHLITNKDLVIDLESLVNTVLSKEVNNEARLKLKLLEQDTKCR